MWDSRYFVIKAAPFILTGLAGHGGVAAVHAPGDVRRTHHCKGRQGKPCRTLQHVHIRHTWRIPTCQPPLIIVSLGVQWLYIQALPFFRSHRCIKKVVRLSICRMQGLVPTHAMPSHQYPFTHVVTPMSSPMSSHQCPHPCVYYKHMHKYVQSFTHGSASMHQLFFFCQQYIMCHGRCMRHNIIDCTVQSERLHGTVLQGRLT